MIISSEHLLAKLEDTNHPDPRPSTLNQIKRVDSIPSPIKIAKQ